MGILDDVRAAVEVARPIAASVRSGTARFYENGNTTPVLVCNCRVKKPKGGSFDAGDQTRWATKRELIIKIDIEQPDLADGIVKPGWIVQIETPDGDETINGINFTVQSSLASSFAAERNVVVATETKATPRIT